MYDSVNQDVLRLVPSDARRILDLGCGTGALGAALGARGARHVTGVTSDAAEAERARQRLDAVLVEDLEAGPGIAEREDLGEFDLIILSHVLEHLRDPERLLRSAAAWLRPGGTILVAIPNLLHWRQRLEMVRGRFRYTEGGVLDRSTCACSTRRRLARSCPGPGTGWPASRGADTCPARGCWAARSARVSAGPRSRGGPACSRGSS